MKKLSVFMLAALMGVFMISCSGGDGPGAKATAIFESVKDKLATMPKEELKAKVLEFAEVIKPVMAKSVEITKKLMSEEGFGLEQAAKAYEDAGFTADDIQNVQKVIEDFTAEVQKNPAWSELQTDEEFSKKWLDALGMSDLMENVSDAAEDATEEMEEGVEDVAEEAADVVEDAVEEVAQ